jgi:hypothetical protein
MEKEIVLEGKVYITANEAARLTGYTNDYIGQLCRGGKVEGKVIGRTRYVCRESLDVYDEESKRAVRAGRHRSGSACKASSVSDTPNAAAPINHEREYVFSKQGIVSHGLHGVGRTLGMIVGIATLFVGMIFLPGMFARTTTLFSDTATLSVYEEKLIAGSGAFPEVVRAYIELGVWSAYRFLSTVGEMTRETISYGMLAVNGLFPEGGERGEREGMVVVPSLGSDEENRELEMRVRSSFSDEVEISLNENGDSGVIRPVFKSSKEDEYMFIMVPLGG